MQKPRSKRLRMLAAILALGLIPLLGWPEQQVDVEKLSSQLGVEIKQTMATGKIPSATIALVCDNAIIWTGSCGNSNLWAGTPAVRETVYLIGSTFKTMSTYALLQQMEAGKFKLDDPVNDYLTEFKIKGDDPANPVTFRHLLTHTSGLPGDFGAHPVWGTTVPPSLQDYLQAKLQLKTPPMTKLVYSNMAFTLVAYLVEKFSGIPFKEYIQTHIFDPLEMNDTAFAPRPDMEERLAIPYMFNSRKERQQPAIRVKANVWPAGIVYGTILNQANWLIANLNEGEFNGHRLISKNTFKQMMTRQFERFTGPIGNGWLNQTTGYGLTWWISQHEGDTLFAHSGSVNGYTAFMVGNLNKKTGFAILTNGHRAHSHLYKLALRSFELLEENRLE